MVAMKSFRGWATVLAGLFALVGVIALLLEPSRDHAKVRRGEGPAAASGPVTLESISGSEAKRIILTAKASERLGIETGTVSEEAVAGRQVVSGLVVPPSPVPAKPQPKPGGGTFGGIALSAASSTAPVAAGRPVLTGTATAPAASTAAHAGEVWVLVTLSPAEWERLAKDTPARLLPVAAGEKPGRETLALPSGMAPAEDAKRSMLTVRYTVSGKDHGLTLYKRMRVELQLIGSKEKQRVIPYSAVYYDAKGTPFVYASSRPLTFERQRVGVERIVGDRAVLSEGPPVRTPVLTVGAPMLFGAEVFKK